MGSDLSMVSYGVIDGIPTMRDSELVAIYERLVADGTLRTCFYDKSVQSAEDFVRLFKSPGEILFLVSRGEEPAMLAWLNGISGKRAFAHFSMFRTAWGNGAHEVADWGVRRFLHLTGRGDEYLFDVICGMTPAANRLACRFVKKFMPHQFVIPGYCCNAWTGEISDGLFTYKMRSDYGQE